MVRFRTRFLAAGAAILAVQIAALALGPGSAPAWMADVATLAMVLLAALAAAHAALGRNPEPPAAAQPLFRRFWSFITLGLLFWAGGQSLFIYRYELRAAPPPTLFPQNLLYFLFGMPLALALFLDSGSDRLSWLASLFDYMQVLTVAGLAYLEFFVLHAASASGAGPRHYATFNLYQLENLILLAGFLLRGLVTRSRLRGQFLRLSLFLGVYAAAAALTRFSPVLYPNGAAWRSLAWAAPFLLLGGLAVTAPAPALENRDRNGDSENRAGLGWLLASLSPLLITRFYLLKLVNLHGQAALEIGIAASVACFIFYIARQAVVQFMLIHTRQIVRNDLRQRQQMEAALRQAQKLEAVGRLAGGVAHDFNNMLTIIQGQCELLQHGLEDPARRQRLAIVLQASHAAAGQVKRLLAFSRQQVLAPRRLDLNRLIDGMLPLLRTAAGDNISLHWRPRSEPLAVQADPAQLEQVLLNLVINARDAIADQGEIWIAAEPAELAPAEPERLQLPPGDYVQLAVSDNGNGIPLEALPHIFEPFFTTKPFGQGTGLGLATVYGIVRQSGGAIEAASQVGQGTRFNVFLPRLAAAEDAAEASTAQAL